VNNYRHVYLTHVIVHLQSVRRTSRVSRISESDFTRMKSTLSNSAIADPFNVFNLFKSFQIFSNNSREFVASFPSFTSIFIAMVHAHALKIHFYSTRISTRASFLKGRVVWESHVRYGGMRGMKGTSGH